MYFKQYLGACLEEEVAFSPVILSMEGFARKISRLQKADNVTLIFELFKVYRQFDKEITLDKFTPLGTSLLRDFNMIDNNLSAKQTQEMFEYLQDTKAIERWAEELREDPEELMKRKSQALTNFFSFWENLADTYYAFRSRLIEKHIAYGGLSFREAFNHLMEAVKELGVEQVVFAGFSQVSTVEHDLMQVLTEHGMAEHYFDSDQYYVNHTEHEAGYFFRKFRQTFAKGHQDLSRNYYQQEEPCEIEVIKVHSDVAQAKVVGQLLSEQLQDTSAWEHFTKTVNHTAVLLPDESMLTPLLYSLPVLEGDRRLSTYTNVTMGVAFQNTPFFDLIVSVFKLQEGLRKNDDGVPCVYFKEVLNIVRHPYFQHSVVSKEYREIAEGIQKEIISEGLILIPLDRILSWGDRMPIYRAIFKAWRSNYKTALQQLFALTEALVHLFDREDDPLQIMQDSIDHQRIEYELLLKFYTVLNRLQDILGLQKENIPIRTFRQLLMELLKGIQIPFTGQPIAPLQVMGMLESRALDFEHVMILSCNEGFLPVKKVAESIIPYDLRIQFGMPTYKHNDIAFAYTFYRLLHRAKKITLLYVDAAASKDGGEMSRFLVQLKEELLKQEGIRFTLSERILQLDMPDLSARVPQQVIKDEVLLTKIKEKLAKGISPSSLNRYIKNPLAFLEDKILEVREGEELEESLDQRTFGTLLHESLEQLLLPKIGQWIDEDFLMNHCTAEEVSKQVEVVLSITKSKDVATKNMRYGKNYILKKVAERLTLNFLEKQRQEAPFFLVAQESFHGHTMKIPLQDSSVIPFRVSGMADRIDIVGNTIRIVDYKTGAYHKENLKANNYQELLFHPEKEKIVQLLSYKYILIQNILNGELKDYAFPAGFDLQTCKVEAGFYFFRKLSDGFVQYQIADEPTDREGFVNYAEKFFTHLIQHMMREDMAISEEQAFV
ncbi:PD-(D/E)XK nuclease family protein [Algivirga pacifica]|uniref:PD-(D/E)XK nuclease family protein n=2 Tax=Algivirga pacifica TaxID=1162670 RepID=A0ABP9DCX8_9BACT